MSFNKITIIGNLGNDPELRYTGEGVAVANFSVATTHRIRDKKETQWFRVTAWRNDAENSAKYLTKGSQVYLEGTFSSEEWLDGEGKNHITLKVDAKTIQFLGSKNINESEDAPAQEDDRREVAATGNGEKLPPGDDIPF